MKSFKDMTFKECEAYAENLKINPPRTRDETSVVLRFALHLIDRINKQFESVFDECRLTHLESTYGEKFLGIVYEDEAHMGCALALAPEWKLTGKKWPQKACTVHEVWAENEDVLALVAVKEPE